MALMISSNDVDSKPWQYAAAISVIGWICKLSANPSIVRMLGTWWPCSTRLMCRRLVAKSMSSWVTPRAARNT